MLEVFCTLIRWNNLRHFNQTLKAVLKKLDPRILIEILEEFLSHLLY